MNRAVRAPFIGLASFFRGVWRGVRRMGIKDWLWTTPALGMIVFLGFVFGSTWLRSESINYQYHQQARKAYAKCEFKLARQFFERYQADNELTSAQKFFWAEILSKTDDQEAAAEVIDELAPLNEGGFGLAHLLKVKNIYARLLANSKQLIKDDPQVLKKLKWHLEHCEDESTPTMEAWALMHSMMGEIDESINVLKRSSEKEPKHYLILANIYNNARRIEERNEALRKAEPIFEARVKLDRLDTESRLILADIYVKQSKFPEAEKLLTEGMVLAPEQSLKRAFASFYLLQFNLLQKQDAPLEKMMQCLNNAIRAEPGNSTVLVNMMRLFKKAKKESPESADQLKKSLQSMVTGNQQPALAHVALSQIQLAQGEEEKAVFHLESAIQIDDKMPLIKNNLAWLLAHQRTPDLNRALQLSKEAAQRLPGNPSVRDTLGTVLMKLERYEEASKEFQLALNAEPKDGASIHIKLAEVLDFMDMGEMAEAHRAEAAQLKQAEE
ncbi:MAG: tetratricopeptide repeat protein [Planctomycetota bacterium]